MPGDPGGLVAVKLVQLDRMLMRFIVLDQLPLNVKINLTINSPGIIDL
jgi:hypothetical protein